MALSRELTVNGARVSVQIDDPETPLLYVLRNALALAWAALWLWLVSVRCLHSAHRRQACPLLHNTAVLGC